MRSHQAVLYLGDEVKTKRCYRCKREKELSDFGKNRSRKDGLATWCKECQKQYRDNLSPLQRERKKYHSRTSYRRHKQKRLDTVKKWEQCNPERAKAIKRKHYQSHREETIVRSKKWKSENPDRVKQSTKKRYAKDPTKFNRWQKEHPEQSNANKKRWTLKNIDRVRKHIREYANAHRDKYNEWKRLNPERVRISRKRWKAKNKEKISAYRHHRRAKMNGNGGKWTKEEWLWLLELCGNKCLCCGKAIEELKALGIKMSKDHIVPIELDGLNAIENLQPLCLPDNDKKGLKIIDYRPQWLIDDFAQLKEQAGF